MLKQCLKLSHTLRRYSSTTPAISLLRHKAYVNGKWVDARDGCTFEVTNPADQRVIGHVPDMSEADVNEAVKSAYTAFESWKKTTAKERSAILRRWCSLINENHEELSGLITLEMGKTLADARGEITYGAAYIEWFAEEARRVYGDTIPSPVSTKRFVVIRQPVGVAGMITPWNFPNAMITRKVSPALAAGCTVVLKPAEDTPFSALALCELAERAGLPAGVLNVVTSSREKTPTIGKVLCEHPMVSKISFTGSTAVGKLLLRQAAGTVKRVSMELGGNAPFIVFDSANVEVAVSAALASKYRCSGQTCVCANRLLVQEGIYDRFMEAFINGVSKLRVGSGFDPSVNVGPLINTRAADQVERHVKDAIDKGGKVVIGGLERPLGPSFFQPTVITGVTSNMLCATQEIFGPLAPVIKFKTEEEALSIANMTNSGLAGYFFSGDISQIWRVAEQLEVGMVGINEGIISSVESPFGGIKESGVGREGSKYGIDEFLNIKSLCFGGL